MKLKNYEGECNGWNTKSGERCNKPITSSALVGTGRCCLIKQKDFGCPNHGQGQLVIKTKWIGVRNCKRCIKEGYKPSTYGNEKGINQIVWKLV